MVPWYLVLVSGDLLVPGMVYSGTTLIPVSSFEEYLLCGLFVIFLIIISPQISCPKHHIILFLPRVGSVYEFTVTVIVVMVFVERSFQGTAASHHRQGFTSLVAKINGSSINALRSVGSTTVNEKKTDVGSSTTSNDRKEQFISRSNVVATASHIIHRSPIDIERLVKARVIERDSWSIQGQPGIVDIVKAMWNHAPEMLFHQIPSQDELNQVFPVLPMDWDKVVNPPLEEIQVTWLGHASLLVQMNGVNILTDPVFSQRCSPFQWLGPKRYRPAPTSLKVLCSQKLKIDLVLISHNHYDHLDLQSIQDIISYSPEDIQFIVPLGVKAWFRNNIIPHNFVGHGLSPSSLLSKIHEVDWHENVDYFGSCPDHPILQITSVPMRHWSNRGSDRDETLWCGYVLQTKMSDNSDTVPLKFLFPGDTAWFDGLHDIGTRYGPFDVSAIPIGAYEPREFMKSTHINVEEAIQMKDAVQAKMAVPIHWGTIDLPLCHEPVMEPREKLLQFMKGRPDKNSFVPWLIGETKQSKK